MKTVKRSAIALVICVVTILSSLIPASADTLIKTKLDSISSSIRNCAVYDMDEKRFIYTKKADEHIYIASTTKLMTSLVALSVFHPDDVITVGQEVYMAKSGSSLSYISPGHKLQVRTLIAALLLPSGNDAAYTVAVNTAKKHSGNYSMSNTAAVTYFCNLMIEEAKKLGCNNTYFVNPEGWDHQSHYSTIEDMTKIAVAAANNAIIASIANIHSKKFYFYSGENITWNNTNKLLDPSSKYYYPYAHGLKTGSTSNAGYCLVAFAEKDGRKLLVMAYGCPFGDDNTRFGKVKEMFEFAFSLPTTGDVDDSGEITSADARLVLRASVKLETLTPVIRRRGDIDKDGNIASSDARHILRAAVNLESPSFWK